MALKTEPLCVARSGQTVDGRVIKKDWLIQAAKNYSKEVYTAVITPDHLTYPSFGLVDAVSHKVLANGEVELYAELEPNAWYRDSNQYGQKLFTSIEIKEDFLGTGEAYLVGLAATDHPASTGTQRVMFSQQRPGSVFSDFIEAEVEPTQPTPNLFSKLFKKPQDIDMTKDEMAQLFAAQTQAVATAVAEALKSFNAQPEPTPDDAPLTTAQAVALFKQLRDNNGELPADDNAPLTVTRFKQLAADLFKKPEDDKKAFSAAELAALKQQIDTLTAQFNQALKEQPGTSADDAEGDAKTLKDCV